MAKIQPIPVEHAAPKTQEQLPRLKPRAKFKLMYHPNRWGWNPERSRWYPMLGEQLLDPGVGGVDEHRSTVIADAGLADRGWQILPVATSEYLGAIEVFGGSAEQPKIRHVSRFVNFITAGNQVIEESDQDAYYAWIDTLIAREIIPAEPAQHVKDMILGKARTVASGEGDRASTKPSAARAAAVLKGVVDGIEAAEAPKPPAPKPIKEKAAHA